MGSSKEGGTGEPETLHAELRESVSGCTRASAFEVSTHLAQIPWRELEEGHYLAYSILCDYLSWSNYCKPGAKPSCNHRTGEMKAEESRM